MLNPVLTEALSEATPEEVAWNWRKTAGPGTDALLEWIRTNFFISQTIVAKCCSLSPCSFHIFHIVIPNTWEPVSYIYNMTVDDV